METYDYVIVGGGISGLYASYKLHDIPNKAIFESTFRLGGRALTNKYQDMVLDYGATRFQLLNHVRLVKLLQELYIPYRETERYNSANAMDEIMLKQLTPQEFDVYNNAVLAGENPCKRLIELALKLILGSQWDFETNNIFDENRIKNLEKLKKTGVYNNKALWKYGIWDLLCNVLSIHALRYIWNNSTFYHMIEYNINALSHICFMLDILAERGPQKLYSLTNGIEDLALCLQRKIIANTNIFTKHTLFKVEQSRNNIKLKFKKDDGQIKSVYTKRLLLCLNGCGMRDIQGLPTQITRHLDSIIPIPLFKLIVIVKIPSWTTDTIIPVHDSVLRLTNGGPIWNESIPCREIHYRYDAVSKLGELLIYGDFPSINFWKFYCNNKKYQVLPECDNSALKEKVKDMLTYITKGETKIEVLHVGIRDWSLPPFGAGVHFWTPGVNPSLICNEIRNVPFGKGHIQVCGEAFNFKQGYIESALESVDEALAFDTHIKYSKTNIFHSLCFGQKVKHD